MKFPSSEFDDAVAALCHGAIRDEAMAELHELLRADAAARDEYLWRVEVHGKLATSNLDFGRSPAGEETTAETSAPRHSAIKSLRQRPLRPRRRTVEVALLVLFVLGLWMWRGSQSLPLEPVLVARFGELQDCRWMDSTARVQSGDTIVNGQRIELSAGSADVLFNTGARLKLVGPAIIETRTDNSVFLTLGEVRLVAETPESKGFTVVTPNSKFVDISTAFTATVSPDGLSRLDVTEGEVDVVLDGIEKTRRLRAGETLYVEPGKRKIVTLIEAGEGTADFRFPTIAPPSREDYADQALGNATIRVTLGELQREPKHGGPASVLIDGEGQSMQDSPRESAFFKLRPGGSVLMDLGQAIAISRINSYSWHQNERIVEHRERARQQFTLYGFAGDELPDLDLPPERSGWTRIARVNSDTFFRVNERLDRPAQQACSIAAAEGDIGQFRYLLWVVKPSTFYGEFDVYGAPLE